MKKVALVVGHRSLKKGAYGNAGVSEFDYNSALAKEIKKALKDSKDVEIEIFYRDNLFGGYGEKMKRLHKRIDEWGADYSISLHFNAAGREDINGHEVLYCSSRGKKLAKKLNKLFTKYLGNKDRKIKKRTKKQRGGGFLCRGKSVCVLAEPFFAAHQKKFMPGTDGYNNLLIAYLGFIDWLGEQEDV